MQKGQLIRSRRSRRKEAQKIQTTKKRSSKTVNNDKVKSVSGKGGEEGGQEKGHEGHTKWQTEAGHGEQSEANRSDCVC